MPSTVKHRPWILRVWDYFRPSWEGPDGKFSYKRASALLFAALIVYIVLKKMVVDQWSFYTFITIAVLFALVATIISVPQLISLVKGIGNIRNTFGNVGSYPLNNTDDENINTNPPDSAPDGLQDTQERIP